jgi:hypothetical protein
VQIEPDWCGKLSRFALLFEALVKPGRRRAVRAFLNLAQFSLHLIRRRPDRFGAGLLFLRPHGMARNNSFVSTPRQRLEIDSKRFLPPAIAEDQRLCTRWLSKAFTASKALRRCHQP